MVLTEDIRSVESPTFASELNLAAGTKAFRRALLNHPDFKRLKKTVESGPDGEAAVIRQIEALVQREIDEHYENPFDVALSAYLAALEWAEDAASVAAAAQSVLGTANCWWAYEVARDVLTKAVATGRVTPATSTAGNKVPDMGRSLHEIANAARQSIVQGGHWLLAPLSASGWREETLLTVLRQLSAPQRSGTGKLVAFTQSPTSRGVGEPSDRWLGASRRWRQKPIRRSSARFKTKTAA